MDVDFSKEDWEYVLEDEEYREDSHLDDLDDNDEDFLTKTPRVVSKHMSDTDFVLGSPLIADNVDAFVEHVQSRYVKPIFIKSHWSHLKDWTIAAGAPVDKLSGSSTFHSNLVGVLQGKVNSSLFSKFLEQIDKVSRDTFVIPKKFFLRWIGKDVAYKDRSDCLPETRKYGALFMEAHFGTILLNLTKAELHRLAENNSDFDIKETANFTGVIFKTVNFGDLLIGGGFVISMSTGQVYDRTMWLMVKDLLGGRLQVLLHCQYKTYPSYRPDHYQTVLDILKEGDELIREYGVEAYSVIKLVEGIASDKINKILMERRRRGDLYFKSFSKHIRDSIDELNRKIKGAKIFYHKIQSVKNIECLITVFGMYRTWGHPFVDYLNGLSQLYDNTHITKEIDKEYASLLASDFAFKVLKDRFDKKKIWYVDKTKLADFPVIQKHVKANTWPKASELIGMEKQWHLLPLVSCFDIPEVLPPQNIYSDKSYSPTRKEIASQMNSNRPIKALRVLESFLSKDARYWKTFCEEVDHALFDKNDLVIGLVSKEREMKIMGRFFALMSWKLREYFVLTEYLIKEHYIPLFKGLTMADSLTTVTQKMWKASAGQSQTKGGFTITNSIDYSKWNNHQRAEATDPVFRVMGQFFGFPNLFTRTHEIFKNSAIYYKDRPDLFRIDPKTLVFSPKKEGSRICWEGQAGGLEGLRQKGWSILNYLCLERERKLRNTGVQILAQGDNQIIATSYKIPKNISQDKRLEKINEIVRNNQIIMDFIKEGTRKLGLIINEDETMQSCDMMIYGKVLIVSGMFRGLHEKRLSRIQGTTNDQFPSLSSIMGAVATNCLTVSHYSDSPINAICQYNWLGNFTMGIVEIYNPAIRAPMHPFLPQNEKEFINYRIRALYLDPSIGGVTGMPLTRFLLRRFPDPVTESLSFWKGIYDESGDNRSLQDLSVEMGHPKIISFRTEHFQKLIENPSCLNIPKGTHVQTVLRDKIREALYADAGRIKNAVVKQAVTGSKRNWQRFLTYLKSVRPLFPRFLSEFASSTYFGMMEATLRLFENSKTIRTRLIKGMGDSVDRMIVRSEQTCIQSLLGKSSESGHKIWKCSASQADLLRKRSWGSKVIGATVPHPFELLRNFTVDSPLCRLCNVTGLSKAHVKIVVSKTIDRDTRGAHRPYLGSNTAENTSILQPWDKQTEVSFMKRAYNMRKAINWMIKADSKLAKAILANITSCTGEEPSKMTKGFTRTGSSIHRFACDRISPGGFSGSSPNLVSYFVVTTDHLSELGNTNYDFMHQSLILYAQGLGCGLYDAGEEISSLHAHITCQSCVRKIDEPILDTNQEFTFDKVHHILGKWKPDSTPWSVEETLPNVKEGDWSSLNREECSFHVGRLQGFYFSDSAKFCDVTDSGTLFPNVLKKKLDPKRFLEGIMDGVVRASAISLIHKLSIHKGKDVRLSLAQNVCENIRQLCSTPSFLSFLDSPGFHDLIFSVSHRIPPSYPATAQNMGSISYGFLYNLFLNLDKGLGYRTPDKGLWIFADLLTVKVAGPFVLADEVLEILTNPKSTKAAYAQLKDYSHQCSQLRNGLASIEPYIAKSRLRLFPAEVRAAMGSFGNLDYTSPEHDRFFFKREYVCGTRSMTLENSSLPQRCEIIDAPSISCALINGLRLPQLATGSHLKLLAILDKTNIPYETFISAGDGSGGWTSCLLRYNPGSKGYFNSLLSGEAIHFRGGDPVPPGAVNCMSESIKRRCLNLTTCWEQPADLASMKTWRFWIKNFKRVDLLTMDMEVEDEETFSQIKLNFLKFVEEILTTKGSFIFKSYVNWIQRNFDFLDKVNKLFRIVELYQTDLSGSHTSEVYIVGRGLRSSSIPASPVDRDEILKWLKDCYCFRTEKQEFDRALRIPAKSLLQGVPSEVIPSMPAEWMGLLTGIGVSGITATKIASRLGVPRGRNGMELALAHLILAVEDIIPSSDSRTLQDSVPSDPTLENIFSLISGFMYWMSWVSGQFTLYQAVTKLSNAEFSYFYEVLPGSKESSVKVRWSTTSKFRRYKTVSLASSQGLIAQIIRLMTRFSSERYLKFDPKITEKTLKELKKVPSINYYQEHTGLLDFF